MSIRAKLGNQESGMESMAIFNGWKANPIKCTSVCCFRATAVTSLARNAKAGASNRIR